VFSSSILRTLLVDHPGWTIAVALGALILLGRAKPVRHMSTFTQRAAEILPGIRPWVHRPPEPMLPVERQPVSLYRRPGALRRLASLVGTTALGLVVGVVIAVVVGAVAIWLVGAVTGRLK
jgi:hypothetical protein